MEDQKFWEWLQERGRKNVAKEEQPRLQIPLPPIYSPVEKDQKENRGVCVIKVW